MSDTVYLEFQALAVTTRTRVKIAQPFDVSAITLVTAVCNHNMIKRPFFSPTTGQTNKNLPMAKQTIDILSMLEEKTAGNLNSEETNLLKSILYDLRIIYVKESG